MTQLKLAIILIFMIFSVSCGGRVPSAKSAQHTAKSHFKSYGRKYDASLYRKDNFRAVQINQVQELSYKRALVDALVSFKSGEKARVLLTMENKFPKGWHVVSWEQVLVR